MSVETEPDFYNAKLFEHLKGYRGPIGQMARQALEASGLMIPYATAYLSRRLVELKECADARAALEEMARAEHELFTSNAS